MGDGGGTVPYIGSRIVLISKSEIRWGNAVYAGLCQDSVSAPWSSAHCSVPLSEPGMRAPLAQSTPLRLR